MTQEQINFIEKVGNVAAADMKKSGVLASLTIAQAILESGWGKSGLTVKGNALFGIKATGSWQGKVYNGKTQECYDGVCFTTITAGFRAYNSWTDSVADHSALLTGAARYNKVVGERDYKAACVAIAEAGYATDPAYSSKLISLIEQYGLTKYDTTAQMPADADSASANVNEHQLREKAVNTATSFHGMNESDGSHKAIIDIYNGTPPLARGCKISYTDAWCACFVSVVAIKAGLLEIIPKEISCERMIERYKALERWQENDAYTPQAGDVLFYDWQDSGAGDNIGASDHVGIVVAVSDGMIKIIEGNISNAVGYRSIAVNGRTIRGYGLPDYAKLADRTSTAVSAVPQKPMGSIKVGDIAQFAGGAVYASANAAQAATVKNASRCHVTLTHNGAHPYHLISIDGKGVYGWVNAADVRKEESA